ncbi:hypothetical protein [Glutamicibacter protophormiae]|uniref:hypothetical protein n=1 Tax=Glutamicibacter protophormiae TaxID=37930 RepID=UPI00195C6814|nr:hypothetical protein [Glutamicibacter protophormiae]QRQ77377.1 hypothetical protein JQN66_10520 [Glutamicibacter protophormiae]
MSAALAWTALVSALVTVFGASLYLGFMTVAQFFLRPVFLGLRLDELSTVFAVPITAITRFLGIMFLPLLVAPLVQMWLGRTHVWALAFAIATAAAYMFLALWYALSMRPVNQQLLTGAVTDESELRAKMRQWVSRNWARFYAALVYWAAAVGYLLTGHELWEALP